MSDPTFAFILTLAFFALLIIWVPFLDSLSRLAALLRRRQTMEQLKLGLAVTELVPKAQR